MGKNRFGNNIFHISLSDTYPGQAEVLRVLLHAAARVSRSLAEHVLAAADAMGLPGFTSDIADLIVSYLPPAFIDELSPKDSTPLILALRGGIYYYDFSCAWLLLRAGADPNATDHLWRFRKEYKNSAILNTNMRIGDEAPLNPDSRHANRREEWRAEALELISHLESATRE